MSRITAAVLAASVAVSLVACARAPAQNRGPLEVKVDQSGFVPAELSVPANQEVTLRVTRTTDHTCAKEIVIKDQGIAKDLPLNEPVEVRFTPSHKGDLRFACAMDMIAGTIHVQ